MKICLTQPNLFRGAGELVSVEKAYQSFAFFALAILLAGCVQATPALPGAVYREETVALPTGAPTPEPTPVSTRVISADVLTPGPAPTMTTIPDEVRALVAGALDGDTISVVLDGETRGRSYTVRYLGIDAPPNTASVPWGVVAFETNLKLTKGKVVRLERDQSDVDDEGNLLRYVYLGDDMLSIILTEQGLARANVTAPDTRFQDEILEAEERARNNSLGVWGRPPTRTPEILASPSVAITTTTTTTATVTTSETTEPATTPTSEAEATAEESSPTGSPSPATEADTTGTPQPEAEDSSPDATSTTAAN
jgi:micrococcal nuclease